MVESKRIFESDGHCLKKRRGDTCSFSLYLTPDAVAQQEAYEQCDP
jgi:hypothetical protein